MTDDDKKKMLQAAATEADRLADEHAGHEPFGCNFTPFMRAVARSARGAATSSGPAQVATPAFRENWETLFGKKQTVGQA